ncbi:hypothetical protein ACGFIY_15725 [Micromonospora chersina]|uniref:hypothetical protein n=1 Tax=Micromonospora chersina TaxID=47854 RepID=UPI003714C2EC
MTLRVVGRQEESAAMFRQALDIATRIAHPYEQARALSGLAEHLADTDPEEARRYRQRALAIFEWMDVPEQFEIRGLLAEAVSDPA